MNIWIYEKGNPYTLGADLKVFANEFDAAYHACVEAKNRFEILGCNDPSSVYYTNYVIFTSLISYVGADANVVLDKAIRFYQSWNAMLGLQDRVDIGVYPREILDFNLKPINVSFNVSQEKPCYHCGRKNDLGVTTCWNCCCKNPTK